MPRPRHHPAAVAEVVLQNEPPAARSVAQLLSHADQVAASQRLRAQERENAGPRRSTSRFPPDGGLLRNTNRSFSRLVGALLARPRPEQAPSCGRKHPLSPYLQRLAHRSAVANSPLVGPQRGSAAVG